MLSPPQAAGLAAFTRYFPPSCFHPPHLTAQGWLQVCLSCSFWPSFNWVSPWSTSRKTTGWCIKMPPDQIKSSVFLLMAVAERGWAGHGSHPRVMAGSWSLENQYVFLSSLRELCLSLAITVCHTTERRGHTFSSHASFHPGHDGISLPHTLSTSKGKHVILLSSHGAKKALLPPRDVYSSSADRSAEPLPSFIYLPIRLPASALCHLSPVFTTWLYAHWGSQ